MSTKHSPESASTPPRFDVVIYRLATRKVASVVGRNLVRDTGTYNAEKRLDTTMSRINLDDYSAAIVPTGKFKIEDTLPEGVD